MALRRTRLRSRHAAARLQLRTAAGGGAEQRAAPGNQPLSLGSRRAALQGCTVYWWIDRLAWHWRGSTQGVAADGSALSAASGGAVTAFSACPL